MSALSNSGSIVSVCSSPGHTMSKPVQSSIVLVKGLGVEGDAHAGVAVKHRSRVLRDPSQPNLRQVHLVHSELHAELGLAGFEVQAGQLGENILTEGVDLLSLGTGTMLKIGETAIVQVTGLRNPCSQLDGLADGLMQAVLGRDESGSLVRKAGVVGVVIAGGEVKPSDGITTTPPEVFTPLEPV